MVKLSSKHYIFFILAVSSISLRSYSSIFIHFGGRDTWIAALIAGAIYVAFSYFIIYVCKRTDTFDIREIFSSAYPKVISDILMFLFALQLFMTSVETSAVQADSIHANIFLETPIWYSLLFFIIPAAYLITRRLDTLVIVMIILVILVFLFVFVVELFTIQYNHYDYLLPIMAFGINKEFLISILLLLGSFSAISITLPYLRFVDKKNKITKHTVLTSLFVVFICVASVMSAIATFGPVRAANIYYPEFLRVQRIQLKGFIEFGDFFFISKTTCIWLLKYTLSAVGIKYIYKDKLNNKKIFAIVYSIAVFICSYLLTINAYILTDFLKLYQLFSLTLFCILPFITFLIYFIKWRKKLKPEVINKCDSNTKSK